MTTPSTPGVNRRRVIQGLVASLAVPVGLQLRGDAVAAPPRESPQKVWRLAVVPQLTPVEISRYWSPIVMALTAVGFACELIVYPSIAKFEAEFLEGKADLVFLNPYHMVLAHKAHRYEPLLRDSRPLEGVLLVKFDSPVKDLAMLKDHRISFPAPNAFAASLYIRAVLERQYHLPFEAHYAQNHRNAVRQVMNGDSAAAGVVRTTLEKEPPEVRQSLRILYTTPELSPHPLAVHPRVPAELRKVITQLMLDAAKDPARKSLMAGIQMPDPVAAHYRADYAPLEKLKLEKFTASE